MIIPLPPVLPRAVKLPTRTPGLKVPAVVSAIALRRSRTLRRGVPIRHCSGWGLPYRPCCQVRGGLLPHRFTITVDPFRASTEHHGRLFSVALSLRLPSPGVTRHPIFMESGLSSKPPLQEPRDHPAIRAIGGIGPTSPVFKLFIFAPSNKRSCGAFVGALPKGGTPPGKGVHAAN
jgi:hypothetical protein